jgi:uncharacterized protein YjbI with pentapeptide repeats
MLEELIELNADEWNTFIARRLGMDVNRLREVVVQKEEMDNNSNEMRVDGDVQSLRSAVLNARKKYISSLNNDRIAELRKKLDTTSKENTEMPELDEGPPPESEDGPDSHIPSHRPDDFSVHVNNDIIEVNGAVFVGKIITHIDFVNVDFTGSMFSACVFFKCTFDGCVMNDTTFSNCTINQCSMIGQHLLDTSFFRCVFMDTSLNGAIVNDSIIVDTAYMDCQLQGATFDRARINTCAFSRSDFSRSRFTKANIKQCSFSECSLTDTDFQYSHLFDDVFVKCDVLGIELNMCHYTAIASVGMINADNTADMFVPEDVDVSIAEYIGSVEVITGGDDDMRTMTDKGYDDSDVDDDETELDGLGPGELDYGDDDEDDEDD